MDSPLHAITAAGQTWRFFDAGEDEPGFITALTTFRATARP